MLETHDIEANLPVRQIEKWADLSSLVEFFSIYNGHDWLFRGVSSKTYALVPKIGRPEARKWKTNKVTGEKFRFPYKESDERGVLQMFKDAAHPYINGAPQTEIEWLALAQHHGVPTRLLDWTEGLLVSAWFAVLGGLRADSSDDPAIWVTRGIAPASDVEKNVPFEIESIRSYRAPHTTPRISAQRSVFTINCQPTVPYNSHGAFQIPIARKACFTIRKRLDACGVNEKNLFPDLAGLGTYLEWKYKNNWLAGYNSWVDASSEDSDDPWAS